MQPALRAGRAFARNKRNPTCGYAAYSHFLPHEGPCRFQFRLRQPPSWRPEGAAPAASTRRSDSREFA
jgi:hypothetical protein